MADEKRTVVNSMDEPVTVAQDATIETRPNTSPQTTKPNAPSETPNADPDGVSPHAGTVAYEELAASDVALAPSQSYAGQLGRFHYISTLGEGTFGAVVRVWDPELETHRAVKVPHRNLVVSGRVNRDSYIREARKLAQLEKHPGIVKVLDVQRMEDGLPFVVSEFVAGGSLADRIKRGRLTWQESVQIVAHVADAISFAHSKGVVHRDLKPANILLTEEGRPIVADFGLALGDDEHSHHASICGTYQYMSPQQVAGQADRVDGRSDIFSLGVILYQLVAGRLPYKSRDVQSLKQEILEHEPAPLRQYNPEAPEALQTICERAMAKEPEDRYSTAADLAAALRGVLESTATGGISANSASQFNWWLPTVAAVLGCALVGLGLFAFVQRERVTVVPTAPQAASLTPDLQVHIQKSDQRTFSPALTDADLPLTAGDKLQFNVARLPKPMFAYVYWIDADAAPKRLWPDPKEPLTQQTAVTQLTSPPGANSNEVYQPMWEIGDVDGPLVFFVGLSESPLSDKQLRQFEEQSAHMRISMLNQLERSGNFVAEFEFPERSAQYIVKNDQIYRTRGEDLHVVIVPKVYASDHSQLQKWFDAYHGWIVHVKR